ncbi:MAG: hypothetical protein ABIO45_13395 [Burkholderiaceae bacterium]
MAAMMLCLLIPSCASTQADLPGERSVTPAASGSHPTIQAVLADAASRMRLDPSQVKLVSSENVTWPDGSLGCPVPGMLYTMAIVAGYRIRIQTGAQRLQYHAASNGKWLLCAAGRATEPVADLRN